ncbi:hypothetical protein LMG7141_00796 [Ralstonia condita]|uniref:Bacteriophage protein n=1 Tax=Ralstonia condita TaxID=3058600 RepID=A0ABM9J0W0_9RALS|nr:MULTISPECIES: hypothetical protein [Ralstonia]CAJ0778761.1 hypothetical protein LMG7141_00796 [Ralstonia sp. LMG 7141]CAJ0802988.1 hypothetical protein LMG18090_04371 [Ralstonia mannitolilytica]
MSTSSQVAIANMALDAIGTRSTIAAMNEGSAEANAINRHWDNAVASVLRAAHWNFARKQVALTLLQDGTNGGTVPTPWLYEYAYPSDCLLMRYLMPLIQVQPVSVVGSASPVAAYGPPVKFVIGTDVDLNGNPINVILTNQPQAVGVYTFRNTNTAMWDELFVQALASYLGSRVCIALTGDKAMMKMAFDMAVQHTLKAQAQNGNEGLTKIDITPDWMRVRGYYSDWAWPDGGLYSYGPQSLTMVS